MIKKKINLLMLIVAVAYSFTLFTPQKVEAQIGTTCNYFSWTFLDCMPYPIDCSCEIIVTPDQ